MTNQLTKSIAIFFSTLLLIACTAVEKNNHNYNPNNLLNAQWQWIETVTPVETITATDPQRYSLTLLTNGKAQILFDCNRGGGTYTTSEGKLSFGQLFSTRRACKPGSQDSVFMRDLSRVTSFFIEGDDLYLELPADSGTLHFRKITTPIYKM